MKNIDFSINTKTYQIKLMLIRTQQNHLKRLTKKEYKIILDMMKHSKLLYNETLYKINQQWEETGKHDGFNEMYHIIKNSVNFKFLPADVANHCVRQLYSNMASFYKLRKMKREGKYDKKVNFPNYRYDDLYQIKYPRGAYLKIIGSQIRIALGKTIRKKYNMRHLFLTLPKNLVGKKIKQIRILPRYNHFEIEYVYEVKEKKATGDNILALDLGLYNFATAVDTDGTSFIIDGKGLKSYNRLHNKLKAKLSTRYSRQGIHTGKEMRRLGFNRKNWVNNYMNQVVDKLIKYSNQNKISKIVYGNAPILLKPYLSIFNDKLINQNFNFIPYGKFIKKFESKCERYGIELVEVDEPFTSILCSKCGYQETKNRISRGVFHCRKCSNHLHADVNAAVNIGKQVSTQFLTELGGSGCMIQPVRVRIDC